MNHLQRISSLKNGLLKKDAFYAASASDVFYLSGFRGTFGRILLTPSGNFFLTDRRYEEAIRRSDIGLLFQIEIVADLKNSLPKLLKPAKRVFISGSTPLSEYLLINNCSYGTKPEVSQALSALRAVKDRDELALIKKAVKIAEKSFRHTFSILKPGIREAEVSLEFEFYARKMGADSLSFTPIVAFGSNSSVPHHATGKTRLKKGMTFLIDAGVKYRGYCSDLTRTGTFCIMRTQLKKVQNIYNIAKKAKETAVKALRSGIKCRFPDFKAREFLAEMGGYDKYFTHSLGHSLGIDIHESPYLSSREESFLKSGCTLTVEPGLYFPGEFGIRIEDDYTVTKNGAIKLGTMSDSLVIL